MKKLLILFLLIGVTLAFGQSSDVMLQGFNWESHSNSTGWYNVVKANANAIDAAGIDMIWMPPPSDAAAPQGYLPRRLYDVTTNYGTEAELKSCINTLHGKNIKVLADIVINHRVGATNWADFQQPTWGCWAVTANDEWGQNGGNPCGNWDTGGNYHAARDIDHTNTTVQNDLIAWMNWLKSNVGFDGWRYDYVRGFNGYYNGVYNDATNPYFSVGELWDNLDLNNVNAHRQQIIDWIDDTQGKSTAFDFTTKGVLQEAVNNQLWRLSINGGAPGVIGWWPAKAVTFIDNHDTGSTQGYWPFPGGKVMQGYAYILTHPGVPCVFWDHLFDWGLYNPISDLIDIRKRNGLTSTSSLSIKAANWNLYAAEIDGKVAMKIGSGSWSPSGSGWTLAASGTDYAVWEKSTAPAGNLTVHFRPTSYSNPEIYFWNATPSGLTTTWPGVSMQSEGSGWYKYTFNGTNCTNFIFSNNGGSQSPDLYTCQEVWVTEGNWNFRTAAPQVDVATDISLYPNPARDRATVSLDLQTDADVQLSLYDLSGRRVMHDTYSLAAGTQHIKLDLGVLPRSLYILKLDGEGIQYQEKLQVE
ncbi:MAG: alpha-amylase C-terminal beta-sheet domain-containing protein [Bacteroidota bacterium]